MKTKQDIIDRFEYDVNGAWSYAARPEDKATFYLGASEAVSLCIEAAKESGISEESLNRLRLIGDITCAQASKAVSEFRRRRPWWKVLFSRLGYTS